MICVSLSDMKLVSKLSEMTEFDMIKIENDNLMMEHFYQLGMDCYDYPFVYIPNYHRNIQNKIVLGYRCVGEVRCDTEFRNSELAGISERLVISSYSDPSFMEEIAQLSYHIRDFANHLNDSDSIEFDEDRALFPADQLEPNWEMEEVKIKELQDILDEIRGGCYNSSGALKCAQEYKDWMSKKGNNDFKD